MKRSISLVTVVVHDYDEAIAWYRDRLGFVLVDDADMGEGKRWVVMSPGADGAATRLLLARATDDDQRKAVGNQTGGRVFLFLHTDDFDRDHAAMAAAGVVFREAPRVETYGKVAVFEDICGNPWDLIEPRA